MSGDARTADASPAETAAKDAALETRLLHTLREAKSALDRERLEEAAELMQNANALCESALRDPSSLSRAGLAEIQRLFAECVGAGKPFQEQLVQRMAESGAVGKAAKAYQRRRRG